MWAEVKKINVRSTMVQTFDNATVIIPIPERQVPAIGQEYFMEKAGYGICELAFLPHGPSQRQLHDV